MRRPITSKGAPHGVGIPLLPKGTLVFAFMALLGLIAVASIVFALVEVAKDGYGRIEERKLVRIF
jgi:hypothetical protein